MNRTERNMGVDVTKILAMLGIVWMHVNYNVIFGGGRDHYFIWMPMADGLIHSFAILSVNCFALASGYLLVNSKPKCERILNICLQVLTWSVVSGVLAVLVLGKSFSRYFDVERYWYVNSYLFVLIFLPFLNLLIRIWNDRFKQGVCLMIMLCLVGHFSGHDMFSLKHGYSALWLSCVYCVGGIIRLREIQVRRFQSVLVLSLFMVTCAAIWVLIVFAAEKPKSFVCGHSGWNLVNTYTSPLVFVGACLMFVVCIKMKFRNSRVLGCFSSHSFAVYLIHMSSLGYAGLVQLHSLICFPQSQVGRALYEIALVGGIYVGCVGLDVIRKFLFDKLKIEEAVAKLGRWLDGYVYADRVFIK